MKALFILLGLVGVARPAVAQIDYRNLDAERPLRTEDAYAIERGGVEIALPFSVEGSSGRSTQIFTPELGLGLDNAQISFGWPMGRQADGSLRSFGPRVGLLYNPFTQPAGWPAVALRLDAAGIEGVDGAIDGRLTGTLIATRAFGVTRAHLNASFAAGPEAPKYDEEYPARLEATIALDRTLWRNSLLLGLEGGVAEEVSGAEATWLAGVGVRWQSTPTDVLDLGLRSTWHPGVDAQYGLSIGLTHLWARGVPSSRRRPSAPTRFERRDEQLYAPGAFNWSFLRQEPEAARLFNAFDYGHAVLYEQLLTERGSMLDSSLTEEYRFLTQDLLVRPPRFAVAEEAVMPAYASEFWRAKQVFEWAHLLHRQIYDVYLYAQAAGLGAQATDSIIESLTDRYLERRAYALAPVPKAMELMEGQPYSGVFARAEPKFNGLIWAYHWLQVGLYEPYARATAGRVESQELRVGGREGRNNSRLSTLDPVLAHFRQMVSTEQYPEVMPMTSAVAPTFTAAHPRAAAIFDNLHALHDVISDILLNDQVVPRGEKRAAVWRALADYQDPTRDVEADEHWRMMGEMVGGVARMGGAVP